MSSKKGGGNKSNAVPAWPLDPARASLAGSIVDVLAKAANSDDSHNWSVDQIGHLFEQPPESDLGDFALPCFRFAKPMGKKPPEVAEAFAAALQSNPWVARTEIVGAFLNVFIRHAVMAEGLLPSIADGRYFQDLAKDSGRNKTRVMVEYSQPNTHKEFHVGHARNVCLGNTVVKLFRYLGYDVIGVNYYGDEGTHIAKVLWYINKFAKEAPATGRGEWLGQQYAEANRMIGDAEGDDRKALLKEVGEVLAAIESKTGEIYDQWQTTRQWSLDDFDEIYKWFHVEFDELFYESQVSEASQAIVDEFHQKGVFIEDDGAIGVDLKDYKLGFMIARKRDGNTLYATKDLALARLKFDQYKIDRSIYVVGDEQNHHFKQVFKVLDLMGFEQAAQCFHLSYGMVVLPEGKMSSRDGTSVTFLSLRDAMLKELGTILEKYQGTWSEAEIEDTAHKLCEGALKFGMLATDPEKKIVFDLNDWLSFEGTSGPYLMYSFTRTQSILRKAQEMGHAPDFGAAKHYTDQTEYDLLRFMYEFNNRVGSSAENCKPSTLVTHLYYMCKAFNRFYAERPVLKGDDKEVISARLALVAGFSTVLNHGLGLLGITPPERM